MSAPVFIRPIAPTRYPGHPLVKTSRPGCTELRITRSAPTPIVECEMPSLVQRVNTLAHIIAGKGVPALDTSPVDTKAFLRATGFDSNLQQSLEPSAFETALNDHLFRIEQPLYSRMLYYPRTEGGRLGDLSVRNIRDITDLNIGLKRSAIGQIKKLIPQDVTYAGRPAEHLLEIYSRIVEGQDAAKIMLSTLEHILWSIEEGINAPSGETGTGAIIIAMRLNLIRRGFKIKGEDLEVCKRDSNLLDRELTIKLANGETTTAPADFLHKALQNFIQTTQPKNLGVRKGNATYNKWLKIGKWAIMHPFAARVLVRVLLPLFIGGGKRGKEVRRSIRRILKIALRDGHMAYLRALFKNNQPIDLKPQYLEDVTKREGKDNAWQQTLKTPSGVEVTYAEVLMALYKLFKAEGDYVSREWCSGLLPQLGIKPEVVDPNGSLEKLPSKAGVINSSHESYFDIATLGWP